jgi:mRNA-degrading endonuclease RelE of RelBE toxin-antitoxin system
MGKRLMTVAEVDPFAATAARAGLGEEEVTDIVVFLAHNPEAGIVMPGTGGLRKLRWAGKDRGKSGGYRVIYYFFQEGAPVYLLAVYPKNQQIDLSPAQKARLTDLAAELKKAAGGAKRSRRAR